MNKFKHILVAIDLSEHSNLTLSSAKTFAEKMDATLSLIHVVENIPSSAYQIVSQIDIEGMLLEEATTKMAEFCEKHDLMNCKRIVTLGSPKKVILEKAKSIGADLIVVGSHGGHGISRFLGSTATAIAHNTEIDVIIINATEK